MNIFFYWVGLTVCVLGAVGIVSFIGYLGISFAVDVFKELKNRRYMDGLHLLVGLSDTKVNRRWKEVNRVHKAFENAGVKVTNEQWQNIIWDLGHWTLGDKPLFNPKKEN